MAYITFDEYTEIIGEVAPDDFDVLLSSAEATIDARTLYGFTGCDVAELPVPVQKTLKRAVAYQVHALDAAGGIAQANTVSPSAVTLGKFSTGRSAQEDSARADGLLSPMTNALLPFLLGWLRGVWAHA